MKTTASFILTVSICVVVVYASKKDVSKGSVKTEAKVVVNQHCNSAAIATEIRSLKEEVKTMKKELTQRLDSKGRKEQIYLTKCLLIELASAVISFCPSCKGMLLQFDQTSHSDPRKEATALVLISASMCLCF